MNMKLHFLFVMCVFTSLSCTKGKTSEAAAPAGPVAQEKNPNNEKTTAKAKDEKALELASSMKALGYSSFQVAVITSYFNLGPFEATDMAAIEKAATAFSLFRTTAHLSLSSSGGVETGDFIGLLESRGEAHDSLTRDGELNLLADVSTTLEKESSLGGRYAKTHRYPQRHA